jgi:hypothetical protein
MRSTEIPGVNPAVDFGLVLAETEWLSPADLRAYQAPLLSKLISHAS